MTVEPPIRLILETPPRPDLIEPYRRNDRSGLRRGIDAWLGLQGVSYRIVDLPSFAFTFAQDDQDPTIARRLNEAIPERLVFGLAFDDPDDARAFTARVDFNREARVASDAAIGSLDSWCPGESSPPFFHTRNRANTLINAGALAAADLRGQGVNVIMVDEGLSRPRLRAQFPAFAWAGGWNIPNRPLVGQAPPDSHGTMVARNVLSLAPRVRLFDLPLLRDQINDVRLHVNWAQGYLWWFRAIFPILTLVFPGRWVFCNAWGMYDRRTDTGPTPYANSPSHTYNERVTGLDDDGHDQVFAAGNCGQFCPHSRCGRDDRGYGRSILGANSHPRVLTVGAVRADGLWLGYSSQGPGQAGFLALLPAGANAVEKPDLCAPSHFVEPDDAHAVSSGTSAACGVAAGAVAALRSGGPTAAMTTADLRDHLRRNARQPEGGGWQPAKAGWNERLGYGVLQL